MRFLPIGPLVRARVVALILAMVATTVAGIPRVQAQGLEKIRMIAPPTDDMTPVFYAIKMGMYQKAGLNVDVIPASNGAAAQNAVIGGAYEMGKSSTYSLVLAYAKGLPISLIAPGAVWDPKVPFAALVVPDDSPIRTASDLDGKTIATNGLNDLGALSTNLWVDKNGGDSHTLKYIEMPNSSIGQGLTEHRYDAAVILDPQLHATLDSGKVRIITLVFSAISNHFVMGAYFANKDWADKHAAAMRKFAAVTAQAARYTNAHPDETAPMMAEVTKIPLPVFQKMLRVEATTGNNPSALLQPLIDAAAKYKYIPTWFSAKDIFFQ